MFRVILLAMALPMVLVGAAFACTVSDAYFSGQFDDSGRFVLDGAMNSAGEPIDGVSGLVLTSVRAADGVTLPTSGNVWAKGDVDFDKGTALVKDYTTSADEAAAIVAKAQGAGTTSAAAGSGCGAAKASAATASAGSGCSGAAKTASAACSATKAASAGCSSTKAAAASSKSAESACEEGCVKPCCAAHAYTYSVSGMTCGACVSKVEGAVKAMENDKIAGLWVDLDAGTAVVTSTEEIDGAAIATAITQAGFPAEAVPATDEAEKQAESDEAAATM